jgi:cob(I)alamin adenosyltransferase
MDPREQRGESGPDREFGGLDAVAADLGSGGMTAPERDSGAYQQRMERRRQVQRQRLEARQLEKGLVLVFTGDGKGKTTAALGLVLRMLGHGARVAVIQFIKGGWQPGEVAALRRFGEELHFQALGEGFTWETQDRERDRRAVALAWEEALRHLRDPERKLVVLDEVNVALKLGYLSLEALLEGVRQRPPLTHVALTGRGAPAGLIEAADLVTEMRLVRHPFREQGVRAQLGIEF